MKQQYGFVIIGGGTVAGYAVKQLIKKGVNGKEICIISNESIHPMNRIPLSKDYLEGKAGIDKLLINPPEFYEEHHISLLLNTSCTGVDFNNKQIKLSDNRHIGYQKLLIATGSKLITLNIPGHNLKNIFYIRTHEHVDQIRKASEKAKEAVVIGGGYIGSEVAATLCHQGIKLTVVFLEEFLLERIMGKSLGKFVNDYYKQHNITLKPASKMASFEGDDYVKAVVLDNGETIPADFVVTGIGCKPHTELFENTELITDNGIPVNEYCETNIDNVYAAGDLAKYPDPYFGRARREEQWKNAFDQGKHVANVMTGERSPYQHLPYLFSGAFDFSYEMFGDPTGAEQLVYRGDPQSLDFGAFWISQNTISAALLTRNRPRDERKIVQEWITQGKQLEADKIKNQEISLKEAEM